MGEYHGGYRVLDAIDILSVVEIGRAGLAGDMLGMAIKGERLLTVSAQSLVTLYLECSDPVGNEDAEDETPATPQAFRLANPVPNPSTRRRR